MKKTLLLFCTFLVASCFAFPTLANAQGEEFHPYKGICWGLYYDKSGETLLNYMVPVEYVRPAWDRYVLVDFLECGKDLIVNITDVNDDPDYYDVHLEMDGGLYDDYGYFYAPFNSDPFKWTIAAPHGEYVGPVYQPGSYYHAPLEYFGLYYVRYPDNDFAYFDIKTQEDYYDDVPRSEIDEEEAALWMGIAQQLSPLKPAEKTLYDLLGRRVSDSSKGLLIKNGRKVMR